MHYFMIKRNQYIKFWFCISAVVLLSVWIHYRTSDNVPTFSHTGGFYRDSFYLYIEADEGSTIYYTLDSSTPDENSIIYTQPILINNATEHENVYSMRTDVSAGFRSDLIELYKAQDADPGYVAPDYQLDKCTVVRAISINKSGIESKVVTESFFVGIEPEEYDGCNIISVVTDPANLFDAEKGIYVEGNIFEEYLENGKIDKYWRFWRANYRKSGRAWEREAFLQIFNEKGECILSKEGGIRTRGNVSKATLPRGLNLYARDEYDGKGTFGEGLFDDGYSPKSISLQSGGNELITQFNDYMMSEQVENMNYGTMTFKPYVLFLDGEYWGFYWLTEKYDEKFIEYHYNVDAEQVIMIKNCELEVGNERDYQLYQNMREFIVSNDMSSEENYKKACELIDINSFLDYYATMIYIARYDDWPNDNFILWRTREDRGEDYADGKWRWMLFDCNSSSMRANAGLTEYDTLAYVLENDAVFAAFWKNALFRELFEMRILAIADKCFEPTDMSRFIDDYSDKMVPILSKSWARFYGRDNEKLKEYNDGMESYKMFFELRKDTVKSWFG